MSKLHIDIGDRKTKCRGCGLWVPAGKACMFCGSKMPMEAKIRVRCSECQKITYLSKADLIHPFQCGWCGHRSVLIR
jgi:Zn finger protein HypA/HybF involved in hydrogenase expression